MEENKNIDQTSTKKVDKAKVKKIVSTSLTVAECILVVFLLIVSILTMGTTSYNSSEVASNPITGNSLFPVLSDSMAPTFKKGDLVYGKQFSNDAVERKEQLYLLKGDDTLGENKGDIISYWSMINGNEVIVTHRIRRVEQVSVGTDSLGNDIYDICIYTRGDAEKNEESNVISISADKIIAKYKGHIAGMGTVVYGLQSNTTLMFCVIVLPLIALFIWNGYSFIRLIFVQKKDAAIEEITMQHEEEKAQILEEAKRLALEELKKEMKEKEKEKDKKSE